MSRTSSQKIGEKATNIIRDSITDYEVEMGTSMIFRELTGQDYGVDAIVELFEDDNPTGKIAFLQIKGTADSILPLQTAPYVSCANVSKSSLDYARQNRVPMILCYASIKDSSFYYLELQSVIGNIGEMQEGKKRTIRIPSCNIINNNCQGIVDIIRSYNE